MRDKLIFGTGVGAAVIGSLILLLGHSNFSNTSPASAEYNTSAATAVPFTKLVQGTQSKISTRTNYLITSPNQLEELWKTIAATGTPPTVDFKTHAVLAVFAGKETAAAISVAKIEDADARMVSIVIAKPDGACAPHDPSATPYELVAVASTTLPVTHEDVSTSVSCPK